MANPPHPRSQHFDKDTWIEPEVLTYPSGGFLRRARAVFSDGQTRIVRCSIPDTFFTIPARGRIKGKRVDGYIHISENVVTFQMSGQEEDG